MEKEEMKGKYALGGYKLPHDDVSDFLQPELKTAINIYYSATYHRINTCA